jgi:hypothetical protein
VTPDELADRLEHAAMKIGPAIQRGVRHTGEVGVARIRGNASGRPGPNVITGAYRNSWRPQTRSLPYGAVCTIGTDLPYGRRLEFGFTGTDSLGRLKEDASLVYQVTSVSGPSSSVISSTGYLDQAEWMADAARDAFLLRHPATGLWLHSLDIPGYRDICRELETEPGGTSDPADAIISYVQRFRIDLSPA